ncbi:MAG: hypothetical protein QNK04_08420 [Myxococcota bacterium]|nr:hypothetical protein [Myxococcota bacterium]
MSASVAHVWGSTPEERASTFPCDALVGPEALACWRAVDVSAKPEVVFRWLCQLRAAPYSYDWIDNGGRRSPDTLTPGLEDLEVGQRVMQIFRIASFERDRHLTLRTEDGRLGAFFVTYRVDPQATGGCRLVVKLLARLPAGFLGRVVAVLFPWGDLVMMRRQLLNLRRHAERAALG